MQNKLLHGQSRRDNLAIVKFSEWILSDHHHPDPNITILIIKINFILFNKIIIIKKETARRANKEGNSFYFCRVSSPRLKIVL